MHERHVLKRCDPKEKAKEEKKVVKSFTDIDFPKKTATLSGLLNQLDGVSSNHGRILIMTSNHADKLDPALIRPGRIDKQFHLTFCSKEQIVDFYKLFFGKDEEIPHGLLKQLPERVFTPAEVSNLFLMFRGDKQKAIESLTSKK